jgi:hypothetical protein
MKKWDGHSYSKKWRQAYIMINTIIITNVFAPTHINILVSMFMELLKMFWFKHTLLDLNKVLTKCGMVRSGFFTSMIWRDSYSDFIVFNGNFLNYNQDTWTTQQSSTEVHQCCQYWGAPVLSVLRCTCVVSTEVHQCCQYWSAPVLSVLKCTSVVNCGQSRPHTPFYVGFQNTHLSTLK